VLLENKILRASAYWKEKSICKINEEFSYGLLNKIVKTIVLIKKRGMV
jgi:hypothetical protein